MLGTAPSRVIDKKAAAVASFMLSSTACFLSVPDFSSSTYLTVK